MKPTQLPFKLEIPTPCHQSWQTISGDSNQRHCASCNKQVHNLETLTARQIELLIVETNGNLCARLSRSPDGAILTRHVASRPSPLAHVALSATLTFATVTAAAQNTSSNPPGVTTHTALTGVVTDNQGALLPGSTVALIHDGTQIGTTTTSNNGEFDFAVMPGKYELRIAAPGFAQSTREISVTPEGHVVGNVSLTPGTQVSIAVSAVSLVDSTTVGELSATYTHWYSRWGYRLRHPMAYSKYFLRKL